MNELPALIENMHKQSRIRKRLEELAQVEIPNYERCILTLDINKNPLYFQQQTNHYISLVREYMRLKE